MKVYLPAIEGHVPATMVCAVWDLIEFSYLVRCDVHDTQSLQAVEAALKSFHHNRKIFRTSGVIQHFNYPRQHSLKHYVAMIRAYGAPNGLCSSMTENKHIKAVKKPWRRSNRYNTMQQMLLTNQRLDKLSASRAHFTHNNMLQGDCLTDVLAQISKYDWSLHTHNHALIASIQVTFKIDQPQATLNKMRMLKIPMLKTVGNVLRGLLLRMRMTRMISTYKGQEL